MDYKNYIIAIIFSVFFLNFSYSTTCWYTFEEDTTNFEKIFIGKVDTTVFLYVGFESAYTKFIPLVKLKGTLSNDKPITIRNTGHIDVPFIKDSIYIIFANKECETCYFSPYYSNIECSSTGLLSQNIKLLEKFKTKEIIDTSNINSLYQKIKSERLKSEKKKLEKELFYNNLEQQSLYYKLTIIFLIVLLTILLIYYKKNS